MVKVVSVDDDRVSQAGQVSVTVRLFDDRGLAVAGGMTDVAPQRYQPNGPDCEPTVWIAYVTASAGGLTPTHN